MPRVNVYIDGFNLYYGALKRTPYKWLDVSKLCQALLPTDTIQLFFSVITHVQSISHSLLAVKCCSYASRVLKSLFFLALHNKCRCNASSLNRYTPCSHSACFIRSSSLKNHSNWHVSCYCNYHAYPGAS